MAGGPHIDASVIAANIVAVRARIGAACERSGRDPRDITLVGVSKTQPAAAVAAAWGAGLTDFGENRVQEAADKIPSLRAEGVVPVWHLIGHLQTNKAAAAIDLFDRLHSVDSERIAVAIDARASRRLRVLLEVNVSGQSSKQGVAPGEAARIAEHLGGLRNLDLAGLMTVAPQADDPESVRPVFRRLRELRDAIGLRELSMGMTDDFEVAVQEGSTLVRVGRAIFGPRGDAAGLGVR
jgi:pyridoxal phosphate enzyme (YggS family)